MVNGKWKCKMMNGKWEMVCGMWEMGNAGTPKVGICKEIATNSYKCPSTCQASKKQATEKNQMSTIFGE